MSLSALKTHLAVLAFCYHDNLTLTGTSWGEGTHHQHGESWPIVPLPNPAVTVAGLAHFDSSWQLFTHGHPRSVNSFCKTTFNQHHNLWIPLESWTSGEGSWKEQWGTQLAEVTGGTLISGTCLDLSLLHLKRVERNILPKPSLLNLLFFNTNDNLLDKKCILLLPSDCLLVALSSVL